MLKSIPASSEFWIAAHHGLRPLDPYPVQFALRDPYQYGPGVPEGTFAKILQGMFSGDLDEVSTVHAISAFSNYCTEEEWNSWYKPVLEKRLHIPVTITEFNKACPKEHRIDPTEVPTLAPLVSAVNRMAMHEPMTQSFVLEPYNAAPRLLVLLRGAETLVFLEDGTPVARKMPKVFDRFRNADGLSVVLEVYEDEGSLIVRDVLLWDQYIEAEPCPPVSQRLGILKHMLAAQEEVEVIEHWLEKPHDSQIREDIALILQSGYPGVVFRPSGMEYGYWHKHANIVVHPTKRSVLTCSAIEGGIDKYEERAVAVYGRGTMRKKQFEVPVFHGLTFSDRGTIFQDMEEYIGQKFVVESCGLDNEGQLVFPVFKHWKE